MLLLINALAAATSEVHASSCFGNFGDVPVIVVGEVLDVAKPGRDLVKATKGWMPINTNVADVRIDKVLKGDVGHQGDTVSVAFLPAWNGEAGVAILVSFHRKRYLVTRRADAGADLASALFRNGDVKGASKLVLEVEGRHGTYPPLETLKGEISKAEEAGSTR